MTGVLDTAVGYEGGSLEHPSYKEVCTDKTGHAEVVQVTFDPSRLSYEHLLDAFFSLHDPTQLNHQGPDWGSQYRSIVFYAFRGTGANGARQGDGAECIRHVFANRL